jgi:hypothetical protein
MIATVEKHVRRLVLQRSGVLPLFPHESEDAHLTGATRSLFRRRLALNFPEGRTPRNVKSEKQNVIKASLVVTKEEKA